MSAQDSSRSADAPDAALSLAAESSGGRQLGRLSDFESLVMDMVTEERSGGQATDQLAGEAMDQLADEGDEQLLAQLVGADEIIDILSWR